MPVLEKEEKKILIIVQIITVQSQVKAHVRAMHSRERSVSFCIRHMEWLFLGFKNNWASKTWSREESKYWGLEACDQFLEFRK